MEMNIWEQIEQAINATAVLLLLISMIPLLAFAYCYDWALFLTGIRKKRKWHERPPFPGFD